MMRRFRKAWLPTAVAFLALGAVALAQFRPGGASGSLPTLHASPPPIAAPSMHPIALPSFSPAPLKPVNLFVGKVAPGTKVPLSRLPHLPMKTGLNTIVPGKNKHGGHYRPLAATGASIGVTAAAACATGGTIGDLFNVGCQLTIAASAGLGTGWSATDHYQYYVVPPNSTSATEFGTAQGCTPSGAGDPWTTSNIPTCTITDTLLSTQGTYAFFVYDTTKQVIPAIIFVNAGQVFTIQVYSDPFHTQQQYQFDTQSSPAAYIYLQNVAPSDYYVTYVMSSGVNAYCVFMTPPGATIPSPSPRPTGTTSNLLCDPSTSSGLQAPGGDLSVTWNFASNIEGGAYDIAVYDLTASTLLGEVRVALRAPGNAAILPQGSTTGMNPSPGPNGPTSTTEVAWDGTSDQSVGGITGTTQQSLAAGTYTWTMSNPEGRVLGGPTNVTLATKTTTTNTFAFGATMNPPGEYPSANWTMQLYQPSTQTMYGAQSFQMVGYHSTTNFVIGGSSSLQLNFPTAPTPTATPASIKILNNSDVVYGGTQNADSFGQGNTAPAIIFTTDNSGLLGNGVTPSVANLRTYGNGVIMTFTNGQNCDPSCSTTVTDSSGNSWTATDYCSNATPINVATTNDGCLVSLTPVNSGTVLAPEGSITIPMYWYAQGGNNGWACYNTPCNLLTTVLPTHGLSWSLANNPSNPTAWTPITIGSVNSAHAVFSGTARFDYVGSRPTTSGSCCVTQGTTPVVAGAHFYQQNFTRAEYQNSTPFTAGTRTNVAEFLIKNTSTGTSPYDEITANTGSQTLAIGFPSYLVASKVTTDTLSTGTWGATVACPSSFGVTFVCWKGPTIAGGGATSPLYVDLPEPVTSFAVNELTVQAYAGNEYVWFTLTKDGTSNETTTDQAYSVDSLGMAAYSLNSNLMSGALTPSTIGTGQNPTPFTFSIANTSTSADPFPDSIDAIVLEQTASSTYTVNGTPTLSGAGANWAYKTTYTGSTANTLDYVFSVCGTPAKALLAPEINSVAVPLTTAPYPGPTPCAAANEANSLQSTNAGPLTVNMKLNGVFSAGTMNFNMYAHGANGGGWSTPKTITATFSSLAASSGFTSINGTSVATNAEPTVGVAPPSTYVYTVQNNSLTGTNLTKILITLPAFDVNGASATDGSANGYWELVTPYSSTITLGGTGYSGSGCSVNTGGSNTFNPTPGSTNGQIEVDCGTGIATGKTLTVSFQSYNPSSQSDTYQFPATVYSGAANTTASPSWIGDQQVLVSFSVGLTVVVNPTNPGPGGSTPVVNCTACAFSGATIDFGPIANSASVTGGDVVRASVIYTGATNAGKNWQLSFSAVSNPACAGASCGGILYELLGGVDANNTPLNPKSCGAMTITPAVSNTYVALPVAPSTQQLVSGPENQCSYGYDTIQNYKVQVGTEAINGQIITVTYTLIVN